MSAEFSIAVRAVVADRSNGLCEVCGSARPQEHHHRRGRGMGGTRRADSATASADLHACRDCHRLIESHRNLALLLGWAVPQTLSPASTPVLYRGEWVVLDDLGGWTPVERAA